VYDFILHMAYTVDESALTSILPSLSLINMIYSREGIKATLTSVKCVKVDFKIYMDFTTTQRCETCS
jgi:hypothetical protein